MKSVLNIKTVKGLFESQGPVIIGGPCSAETEEQLVKTAVEIAQTNCASILRAGIWKPRTRPDSFEGVGEKGLQWLAAAALESGLPAATEVANAKHVEKCLQHDINILWVGARTTVSPFAVQEIADALQGTDTIVFVKNPINPDLELWIGALERLNRVGIKRLAAIHRGFSSYEKNNYRYAPKWELPIELKTRFPDLEIFCDPSHIAGRRELLQAVSQKALDLNMDGLMIETHIQPEKALSDAAQQITPSGLQELVAGLQVRQPDSKNAIFSSKLEEMRSIIDEIDEDLLRSFARRLDIIEEIGDYKKENNVTILQLERWKEILNTRMTFGKEKGLSEAFIRKLLQLVHKESIRLQTNVMNKGEKSEF